MAGVKGRSGRKKNPNKKVRVKRTRGRKPTEHKNTLFIRLPTEYVQAIRMTAKTSGASACNVAMELIRFAMTVGKEYKQLKAENAELKEALEAFKTKLSTVVIS